MRKNKQSLRALIAFLVTWAFIVLTITGIILYIVPQGRVAYWVHWSLAGMEKEQWGWVHMMFGGLFIITGFLHLYFNWKPFKKYFADRVKGHFALKQEILVATLLTIAIFVVSALNIPPASWVIDLNGWIKNSWITSPELEPPYGHAEEASLAGISRKMGLDINKVMKALHDKEIQFTGKKDSLDAIARKNNTTPMSIYEIIRVHQLPRLPKETGELSPEEIEAKFSGTGLGRKTIEEICLEVGIDLDVALERLSKADISASGGDKARPIAEQFDRSPIDLLKIMMLP
ncbi:MAG: DUF4405 domain-containing protein [Gammaproteobacteria bacterium]|nr:DUF4405 domain-containing protein [Gammaproteobacteria bacterium]